ncbi:hypothetical protein AALO_G00104840 [Alosa alosa]|uniref:Uncharacterized protein n=1 Tax=Alosa alosa TaxID=278164 RepID=A0AAV6GZ67_9TELE|nr:hypothetical protein AALO_G00104840 [Alosa alosa]
MTHSIHQKLLKSLYTPDDMKQFLSARNGTLLAAISEHVSVELLRQQGFQFDPTSAVRPPLGISTPNASPAVQPPPGFPIPGDVPLMLGPRAEVYLFDVSAGLQPPSRPLTDLAHSKVRSQVPGGEVVDEAEAFDRVNHICVHNKSQTIASNDPKDVQIEADPLSGRVKIRRRGVKGFLQKNKEGIDMLCNHQ